MVPIFTDFRFNIGSRTSTSFFIDIKAGGSFLIGKDYLAVENGYISNSEYFMLKPSLGLRIPVSQSGKQAVNIGITYQLLTCNYWYNYNRSRTSIRSEAQSRSNGRPSLPAPEPGCIESRKP